MPGGAARQELQNLAAADGSTTRGPELPLQLPVCLIACMLLAFDVLVTLNAHSQQCTCEAPHAQKLTRHKSQALCSACQQGSRRQSPLQPLLHCCCQLQGKSSSLRGPAQAGQQAAEAPEASLRTVQLTHLSCFRLCVHRATLKAEGLSEARLHETTTPQPSLHKDADGAGSMQAHEAAG